MAEFDAAERRADLFRPNRRHGRQRSLGLRGRRGLSVAVLGAVVVAQVGLLAGVAQAATLTVNSTADVAATFGACGNPTQTTSSGSLREAVCAANNAGAASSVITVAAGTYTLVNGELQMGLVSGSNITLTGAGAGSTVISGNNSSRVFDLDPSIVGGVTTSISGVTISGGAVTTIGGAGIIAGSGNALAADSLTISSSTLTNNSVNSAASNDPGGGVQFIGGSLTISNSTVSNNSSGSSEGGGVEYQAQTVVAGEHLGISGTTFSGNRTNASVANVNMGGAALATSMAAHANPSATLDVSNSRFINNTVTGSGLGVAHGGAIYAQSGPLSVTASTFTGNSVTGGASDRGGAVSVMGGTTTLHYNRFAGNVATTGSAVSLGVGSGGVLDATENWWGCSTGPGTTGCDTAAGGPTVAPRLVLTATASPATMVGPNATSTVTAALTPDSAGTAIAGAQLGAFAGLPVGWSDPLPTGATLGSASSTLSSGSASTAYNSQAASGPGHVVATLDNGTVTAPLTVNRAPTITSGNTASFTSGTPGSFTVTTAGYPTPALSRGGSLPAGMTFTDNGNGTATLSGTPTAGGTFPLSLTAANGVAPNATQTLTVTVGQAPTFTNATTATFTAGAAATFTITTTGTPTPAISKAGTLPTGLSFNDNGNGTATLSGTPAAGTGGAYTLSLTAANGVAPNGAQTLTVTINQAPAVTTNPSDQTVNAGTSVSFTAAASGFPAPTVQWQRSTDGGGTFSNIAGATSATYTFPAFPSDNGNMYRAVFTNAGGSATSTAATLIVRSAPTITSTNTTSFTVGTAGSFTFTTSGFPTPTLTDTGTLPAWLSFTDNGNGTATLAGTPPAGSGGPYGFTINADNGVAPGDSQAFTLTVHQSPTITSADHTTFQAGTAGSFTVTTAAGYPTGTTITATGTLPSGVSFTDNGDGTATLAGTPAAGTAGSYPITITASNGATANATQTFTLTVTSSPTITSADHTTFVTGAAGSFAVTTTGAAGTTVSYTGSLPSGVTFTPSGSGATIAGTPAANTGGTYPIIITASDGVTPDTTQTFTLTVDQPPTISSADHATFTLGVAGSFTVTTAAGFPASTTITETGIMPSGVTFTDNGDGTATLAGTPTAGGSFPITITASNSVAPDATQAFTLTVDQAPSITSVDHATFAVGTAGSFTVTTSPAAGTVTETGTLPSGVTFTDNGNGTGTLAGTPAGGTGGSYSLSFKATNATGFTTQSFTLTINELASITSADHTTFTVGTAGSFTVTTTAGYPTATTITETGTLPSGVSFTDNGDGTATLSGTPAAGTDGSYPVTITVTNAAGNRQQSFTLTVVPANASPVITSADHATFAFRSAGTFTITTTAGYPTATTITKTGSLPVGVTFTDNGDGTATIAGTPTASGAFTITITASNGASTDAAQSFTLTVTKKPAITSGAATTFVVGTAGSFTVTTTAGYPTTTTLTETGTMPSGVSFTDNGDGTATLAGTPAAGTTGSYPLTITATNAAGSTQQTFTLTVQPANSPPLITTADNATFSYDSAGSFTVTTTPGYPTATTITETGTLPAGVTFTDNHNGTATIAGAPTGSGAFTITITASNGASTNATQRFTLTVTQPPRITSADHTTFTAGTAGSFTVTTAAGYPTATTITETGTLPAGVTFTDNHNGTATITGTPTQLDTFTIAITASNGVAPDASQTFTLSVDGVRLVPGVCGGTDLRVAGTNGNDTIRIGAGSSAGSVTVTINGTARGSFTPTGRLIVLGQAGDDTITVDNKLTIPRIIYGGAGNDTITGGNGNGIQIGGDGNDRLSSGNGRDILIGGTGADALDAGNGDDILITGTTAYDDPSTASALCGLQAEWTRTDLPYATRIAHLNGSTPGGLNGTTLLTTTGNSRTVFDDTSVDTVTGGLGQDWYLVNTTGGTAIDKTDATKTETRTDLQAP